MLLRRFHWLEGILVALLLGVVTWLNSTVAAPDAFSTQGSFAGQSRTVFGTPSDDEENDKLRLREGTEIDGKPGYFRQDGDGATFVTDDGFELGGLPNLNLERVVRTLKTVDETENIRWRVSGAITEFSGRNYLFITRAVYKSAALPPSPAPLSRISGESP